MSTAGMARRCPAALAVGRARLVGWRFALFENGFATIVRAAGCAVHGVLWRVSARDLAALNAYESVASGLYVRRVVAVRLGPDLVPALVYVACCRTLGRPRPGYLDLVVAAARDWELPPAYVRAVERSAWAITPASSYGARQTDVGEMAV